MRRMLRLSLGLVALSLTVLVGACNNNPLNALRGDQNSAPPRSSEPANLRAVSPVAPPVSGMPEAPPPLENRPLLESRGDCAPRYANGQKGSCVNDKPCRGFAVAARDGEAGAVECACYAVAGGCAEGQRCDIEQKACKPEKAPRFGASPAD